MSRCGRPFAALLTAILVAGCSLLGIPRARPPEPELPPTVEAPPPEARPPEAPPPEPEPYELEPPVVDLRSWAERTLESLTLREKVGQMIMPWVIGDFAPEGSASHERILSFLQQQEIGGIIMSVGTPTEIAAKINDLQRHSELPLLVAADLETGAGFRMRGAVFMPGIIDLGGATNFPSQMAIGATNDARLAYEMGRVTALEARAVGIHVPFAPVLDVNNNPANPIINVRSFGEDPERVGALGAAYVRGMQEHGAIATGKHFPGHGDTDTDSHIALPIIRHSFERMDSVELRPFRLAIEAGMGGMMTAHIAVPALNGGGEAPATLSSFVLTDLLRVRLGFEGIVFTDAMDMTAISGPLGSGEAAVRAVEAGADVILMPASVQDAHEGIVSAVVSGRLPEARVDESVLRLLRAKEALGLHEKRTVDIESISSVVGIPEHLAIAAEVAEGSITVIRNGKSLLPLLGTRTAQVMSVSYRRQSDVLAGRFFNARLRQTYPRLVTAEIDLQMGSAPYEGLLRSARAADLVVVSLYVTATSYAGTVAIPRETSDFVKQLAEHGIPHVVVSFGNPYLITDFPDVQAYMLAWSASESSQRAAAQALLGDFDIHGRTPTRMPGFAEIGDGITIGRKATVGGG